MATTEHLTTEAVEVLRVVREQVGEAEAEAEAEAKVEAKAEAGVGFLSVGTAMRYLRGYGSVGKAARHMGETYEYRRELGMENGTETEADRNERMWEEFEKRDVFIAGSHTVVDGEIESPILVVRKRNEAFDEADLDDYRRFLMFVLDSCAALADDMYKSRGVGEEDMQMGQWVVIMDMENYSRANSPPWHVTRETIRIFQNHFPERAKRVVVVDAPGAFAMLWRLVCPFVDPVTRRKFLFVRRSDGKQRLGEMLGPGVVAVMDVDTDQGKREHAKLLLQRGLLAPPAKPNAFC